MSDWLDSINPFHIVWAPYLSPSTVRLPWHLGFLTFCLVVSGLLVGLATLRIRAVARTRGVHRRARARPRWLALHFPKPWWLRRLPGPSLDGNPVFWRKWYRAKPSRLMRLVWMMYWAMGVLWIFLTLQAVSSAGTNHEVIAIMNIFQVALGLLLLSVHAATSLVEERVRGSLDILLSTPLSTPSILAGKWLGTFRIVPQLLFAPALTTLLLAAESGHWLAYWTFIALLLAYSAAIVSLGLALATWQSRLERAVALCVAAYVLLSIGWPVLIFPVAMSGGWNDTRIVPLIMGTPLYGVLFGTFLVSAGPINMPGSGIGIWVGCYLWISIHGGLAVALYALTVATFDRCLGRMPDLMIEWGAAGSFAEESRGLAQERHDFAQLAQGGPPVAGGARVGGFAAQSGQGRPVN